MLHFIHRHASSIFFIHFFFIPLKPNLQVCGRTRTPLPAGSATAPPSVSRQAMTDDVIAQGWANLLTGAAQWVLKFDREGPEQGQIGWSVLVTRLIGGNIDIENM